MIQRPAERQAAIFALLFPGVRPADATAPGRANGGRARMAQMTEAERKDFARSGAAKRWGASNG